MGLEFSDKLDLLGGGAQQEIACQSCAANPSASVVTHRANQPIAASDIQPRPIHDTPLENHAPTNPLRKLCLYQTDFLLRQYGFTFDELLFDENGLLPLHTDPKTADALAHPEKFPLEAHKADRAELLRVPGLGPKSVQRILDLRHRHTFTTIQELKKLGADTERAAQFILLNGKQPARQLALF